MSERSKKPKVEFVEYTIRVPKMVDEFFQRVCLEENKKISDPAKKLNPEAWAIMALRDVYLQLMLPSIQKEASIAFSNRLSKIYNEVMRA